MKIYNTLSEKKDLVDIVKKIGIYVCGVTPYDTTHLGHAFTFLIYDALIRYLRFQGADVTYVQNVTDIDDDILIRAKALRKSWKKLGQEETSKHLKNMDRLNALRPDFYTKATEHIPQMQRIIKKLISQKLAYVKNGSVYFEVKQDKNFGKLSKFGYRAMLEIANERGNLPLDTNKKDPLDFVLWQTKKEDEPSWPSSWGAGRPGWHIECSAMSMEHLGKTITIHGGGSDLIFPHHEAEITQSEHYSGKKFVDVWMHAAMVYYEDKKMSKSLGNMIFISDLLKQINSNAIRFLLLSHHWQNPWNFEDDEVGNAKKITGKLEKNIVDQNVTREETKKMLPEFFAALDNNFDTPLALKTLLEKSSVPKYQKFIKPSLEILGFKY